MSKQSTYLASVIVPDRRLVTDRCLWRNLLTDMWLHDSAPDDLDDSRVMHETEVTVSIRQSLRNNASNNKYLRRGHNPQVSVVLRLQFVCVWNHLVHVWKRRLSVYRFTMWLCSCFLVYSSLFSIQKGRRKRQGREGRKERRGREEERNKVRKKKGRKGRKGEVTSMMSVPVIQHFSPQVIES